MSDACDLREEPSAGKPHARICEGEAEWPSYSTDQALAKRIADFVKDMPMMARTATVTRERHRVPWDRGREPTRERIQLSSDRTRKGPEIER